MRPLRVFGKSFHKLHGERGFTAIFLLLIDLAFTAVYLKSVADYKRAVEETTFGNLDISDVPAGVYVGEYDVDFVYAKVEVTVQNGVITNIDILEHKNGRGKPAEIVIDRIIEEQKIDVDAVSGATNSSTVIKKAVENALKREEDFADHLAFMAGCCIIGMVIGVEIF